MQTQQSSLSLQPSKLKLHYFHIRGTCQPVRNLLYYLEIQFEDLTFDKNNQNYQEVYFNMNFPYLIDQDIKIHETIAIMYYICHKYEKNSLIGHTPQAIARIQEILLKFTIQRKKIMSQIFQMFTNVGEKIDFTQQQNYIDFSLKKLVNQCKCLEYCLKTFAKNRKYVLDTITLVDFIFYEQCFYICGFFQKYIQNHNFFKYFIQFKNNFQSLGFFKKKQKQISQKFLFHAFTNEEMNRKIKENWGDVNFNNLLKYGC